MMVQLLFMVISYVYTHGGIVLICFDSGSFIQACWVFVLFWDIFDQLLYQLSKKLSNNNISFLPVYSLMPNLLLSKVTQQSVCSYIEIVNFQPTSRAVKDEIYISFSEASQTSPPKSSLKTVLNVRERVKTLYCPMRIPTYFLSWLL